MTQYFYEKNAQFLNSPINITFDQVLVMTTDEFRQWIIDLRKLVVHLWDHEGQPPVAGAPMEELCRQFQELHDFTYLDTKNKTILVKDELTNELDVIRISSRLGNAVNQFFPTMLKTRINYTKDAGSGRSIYDFFVQDELLDRFVTYATRHFKRDSFYHYSVPAQPNDLVQYEQYPTAETAVDWIRQFEHDYRKRDHGVDYWLGPFDDEQGYTGHNDALKTVQQLAITRTEIESLGELIPSQCRTNIDWERSESYRIRIYQKGQQLFPVGFKSFRISFSQYAVNFPPPIAKWIYDTFTKDFRKDENIIVWDPSSGWGGRLVGALSADDTRHLTYLGNDPNTDHNTTPGRTKYHEIYDFYRTHVLRSGLWAIPHNDFKFWQLGSEMMQFDPAFQQYKGKVSLVFTSPPYFSKERYSEDPEQSCIKFTGYAAWKTEFLEETIKTIAQWLRPGGYVVWNIADAEFSGEVLPLESDSCQLFAQYGLTFKKKYKMALASMPGGNRRDTETGIPKTRNFCKSNGLYLKYEPLYVFQKPV
jgi:hypothetical protein